MVEHISIEERLMDIEMKLDALTAMTESKLKDIELQFEKIFEIETTVKDTRAMVDGLRKGG